VERYVGYILQHQTESGWLGPDDGGGGEGNTYWTGWNTAIALLQVSLLGDAISLLQYAEARGAAGDTSTAAACNLAVLRYVKESYTRMLVTPLASWSQSRWQVSCQTSWHHCTHGVVNQPSCRVLT
jgi:hypothetical protein